MIDLYPRVRWRSRSAMDQGKLHGLSLGFAMEGWVEVEETFVRGNRTDCASAIMPRIHCLENDRRWFAAWRNPKVVSQWEASEVVPYEQGMAHGTPWAGDDGSLKARVILEQGRSWNKRSGMQVSTSMGPQRTLQGECFSLASSSGWPMSGLHGHQ